MLNKVVTDGAMGKIIMFPVTQAQQIKGLPISPVGMMEEKEKLRLIHELTFGEKEGKRGGKERILSQKVDQ